MNRAEFNKKHLSIKGEIINNLGVIEFLINYILATHVSKDRPYFGLAMLNKVNFNSKIDMFEHLLSEGEPEYKTKYPNLFSQIVQMQELRNKFAHSITQINNVQDYSTLDEFTLLKANRFNAAEFTRTTYKISEHPRLMLDMWKVMKTLEQISGLNDILIDLNK